MKKSIIKKVLVLSLSVCACVGGISVYTQGGTSSIAAAPTPTPGIQPQYTAIAVTTNYLQRLSSSTVNCQGSTTVWDGYNAGVTVELQRNDNGWTTIKTWSDSGSYAVVDENYPAPDGYTYRLKVTSRSYTSGWSLIESVVKYSNII